MVPLNGSQMPLVEFRRSKVLSTGPNTVVETKMSGLKFSKYFNQTSLICIFKAFGVILLHFKVEKLNQGVILQKKIKKYCRWRPQCRVTGTTPIFLFGLNMAVKSITQYTFGSRMLIFQN
jgi:hypothetical protein